MKRWLNRAVGALVVVAVIALVAWAFVPRPVPAHLVEATRGPLVVTVDEDGKTRIRERYIVSSPLSGRLLRIGLDPGDPVECNVTEVAVIEPRDPGLLDARARAEARARVQAAEATLARALPTMEGARAEVELAESDYERTHSMHARGAGTERELRGAATLLRVRREAHKAARFAVDIARFELDLARAALVTATGAPDPDGNDQDQPFVIRAPGDGRVLRVLQESATFITSGAPLLEIGDPSDLEIEVDVLSSDAVRIRPGGEVIIERWGGDRPLHGVVRVVEPAAFTRISALGVEEQRVNVIIDFVDPPEQRKGLGDGFRVEAHIVTWQADDVLRVPAGAVFRGGERWSVFRVSDGHAVLTPVTLGGRTGLQVQILDGLGPGDRVIIYPSDQIANGVAVRSRD